MLAQSLLSLVSCQFVLQGNGNFGFEESFLLLSGYSNNYYKFTKTHRVCQVLEICFWYEF